MYVEMGMAKGTPTVSTITHIVSAPAGKQHLPSSMVQPILAFLQSKDAAAAVSKYAAIATAVYNHAKGNITVGHLPGKPVISAAAPIATAASVTTQPTHDILADAVPAGSTSPAPATASSTPAPSGPVSTPGDQISDENYNVCVAAVSADQVLNNPTNSSDPPEEPGLVEEDWVISLLVGGADAITEELFDAVTEEVGANLAETIASQVTDTVQPSSDNPPNVSYPDDSSSDNTSGGTSTPDDQDSSGGGDDGGGSGGGSDNINDGSKNPEQED
jgi:hypothetical protein